MKTGLFFGSFNPIHIGHIAIAGYVLEFSDLEELWFVVSPQNPLKDKADLANDGHRLKMVKKAIEDFYPKFHICDIEMNMPRPSYTIDTVQILEEKYPQRNFHVVMGSDSMDTISQWKDYKSLLNNHQILVYPRLGSDIDKIKADYQVDVVTAPIIQISSTFIRDCIKNGLDVRYFMPVKAYEYMMDNRVYME
jgi:nicotinate-nucleotide adenylyltransferase